MSEYDLGVSSLGTEVDLAGLDEGIDEAHRRSESGFAKIGDVIGNALKVGILAAGAAVVAGVVGIGAAALDTASQVNQSINDFQANLGVTKEQAEELGDVALRVWGQNWGDSIEDVTAGITTVRQQMKGLADEELEGVTAKAFALRDAFGVELPESTNAANVLMEKFGLTSTQAFDFIAKGFQKGLNNSGDFLESLTEYGVQFSEAGFEADEFFSVLESGQQGFSSLGTDKAADLIKEFRIRMTDLSDTSITALNEIGRAWATNIDQSLANDGPKSIEVVREAAQAFEDWGITFSDFDIDQITKGYIEFGDVFGSKVTQAIADGSITTADAFSMIQEGLGRMEDPLQRNVQAVALFGTQWEDLGESAVLGINPGLTSLDSMAGATDSLNAKYNNFPALFEGFKRSFLVSIEPVGEKLLDVANNLMPQVQGAFTWLSTNLPPIIDQVVVSVGGFIAGLQQVWADIQPITDFIGANLTPILAGLATALLTVVIPAFVGWATASTAAAATTIAALAPVVIPIAAIGAAIAVLFAAWENDWGGIRTTLTDFWESTGRPIFDQLKTWLATNLPVAIKGLSEYWTGTLWPALQKVWDFINANIIPILTALANVWIALVKKEVELLAALWSNVLWPALQKIGDYIGTTVIPKLEELAKAARDTLGPAFTWLNDNVLKPVAGWFSDIGSAVQDVIDFLEKLANAIDAIEIPSWLQGHSPPPMAKWFGDIADESDRMAGIVSGMELPSLSMPSIPSASSGLAPATGGASVHVTLEERGLRDLIKVTFREENDALGRTADARRRTR